MGVNREENNKGQASQGTAMGEGFARAGVGQSQPQGQQNVNQQQGFQQQQGQQYSWRGLGRQFGAPIGRNPASEQLTKLEQALAAKYKATIDPANFKVNLVALDMNNNPSISLSVLVVCVMADPQVGVAYHSLILAGSAEDPGERFENVNGQQVPVLRTPGDANDDFMRQAVAEAVSARFPGVRLLDADSEVVKRDFKVEDEKALHELAANAFMAAFTELNTRRSDFRDFTLVDTARDPNLTAKVTYNTHHILGTDGLPIRADIQIDMIAQPVMQAGQVVERASRLTTLAAFMNLIWDPVPQAQQPYGFTPYQATPQQQNRQLWAAECVITSLEALDVSTLPAQLVALIPALALRDNNMWAQAFRPRTYNGEEDLHDIGAVGIEANFENNPSGYGMKIDTKSDAFRPELLGQLLASVIRPGMILSIDVAECGAQTWQNGVFAAAGEGSNQANQAIIEAANFLTGGAFGRHYQQLGGTGRVASDNGVRVYMGYYTGSDGQLYDLRNIDYLAVANSVGEKDPSVIRDWSDSYFNNAKPLAMRMVDRRRILEKLVNPVITGYGRRVTLEAAFTEALAKGAADAGLQLRTQYPYADQAIQERAAPSFAGSALMNPGSSGVFNQGGFGGQGQQQGLRSGFRRWG